MPKGEPQTEQEAQEMERFLEQGAPSSLEAIVRVSSPSAEIVPPRPVSLDIDAREALEELSETPGDEEGGGQTIVETVPILELEFRPPTVAPEYSITLFLNKRDADLETSVEDPAFAGSIAFFCHAELRDGELVCVPDEDPVVFRLPIKPDALQNAGRTALTVTLVPAPFDERVAGEPLDVTAILEIARSEFVPPE